MLLNDKHAVIYGAAGAIGAEVARAFTREGATVHLTGRTREPLDALAAELGGSGASGVTGAKVEVAVVDALDPAAVEEHIRSMERVDVSINVMGVEHVQGVPLRELPVEDFLFPVTTYATTQFVTATAAARRMTEAGRGVILTLSTTAARLEGTSDGFGAACAAVEALSRQLAGEVGGDGVRVVCLRADGILESLERGSHAVEVWGKAAARSGRTLAEVVEAGLAAPGGLLGRSLRLADVAESAAFYASDRAAASTGVIVNLTSGALLD